MHTLPLAITAENILTLALAAVLVITVFVAISLSRKVKRLSLALGECQVHIDSLVRATALREGLNPDLVLKSVRKGLRPNLDQMAEEHERYNASLEYNEVPTTEEVENTK